MEQKYIDASKAVEQTQQLTYERKNEKKSKLDVSVSEKEK